MKSHLVTLGDLVSSVCNSKACHAPAAFLTLLGEIGCIRTAKGKRHITFIAPTHKTVSRQSC